LRTKEQRVGTGAAVALGNYEILSRVLLESANVS
jgi:hypothetical protein